MAILSIFKDWLINPKCYKSGNNTYKFSWKFISHFQYYSFNFRFTILKISMSFFIFKPGLNYWSNTRNDWYLCKKETCLDMSNVCVHVCKFSEVWTSTFLTKCQNTLQKISMIMSILLLATLEFGFWYTWSLAMTLSIAIHSSPSRFTLKSSLISYSVISTQLITAKSCSRNCFLFF